VTVGSEPPPSKLISIARLEEKKGYPYLLDALARLREKGVPFSLDIYGEGNERASIERRVRELDLGGSVALKGSIAHDRIPDLLRASGIYVLPCIVLANKDRDGIPNTILEALACGVPVVSTNVSGIPEVVEDGRSGLLVPERDPDALAAALERMMTDAALRARCRSGGREVVESMFSVEAAGRRLARLLV
jgi:glycosyltransferase involved in cell wall biosynthesis